MKTKRLLPPAFLLIIGMLEACGEGHSAAYATLTGSNELIGYQVANSSGKLMSLWSSPFATGASPAAICIHPSKDFLYVANKTDGTISLFTIDTSSWALTDLLPELRRERVRRP